MKLSRLAYYKNRIKRLVLPKSSGIERLIYAVTYRCNSKCKMCNIWRGNIINSHELTIDELKKTFLDNKLFRNLKDVGLTGGEPYLRYDLDKIALFFLKNFSTSHLSINTNGLLHDRILNTTHSIAKDLHIRDRQRILISFSLDGVSENHDSIRGIQNNYVKVLEIIKVLKKEIPEIVYSFTFTILPENYDTIFDVYKLSKELGFGFSFSPYQKSGIFYNNKDKENNYSNQMIEIIEQSILEIQKDSGKFNKFYYSKMAEYLRNPRKCVNCYAGINSFFLAPSGAVYPCILFEDSFGSLSENNFKTIWNSEIANSVRHEIRAKRCHCWGCESEISFQRSFKVAIWSLRKKIMG